MGEVEGALEGETLKTIILLFAMVVVGCNDGPPKIGDACSVPYAIFVAENGQLVYCQPKEDRE